MKPLYALVLSALLPFAAMAEDAFAPIPAAQVVMADLLFRQRSHLGDLAAATLSPTALPKEKGGSLAGAALYLFRGEAG